MAEKTAVPTWLTALGDGIARAEGFGIANAIPTTHNNPGDIEDSNGNKLFFPTSADGFKALYANISGAFNGASAYYYPSMTLQEFADVWTGNDNASGWLATVLDVINSRLGTVLGPQNTLADVAGASNDPTA